jgi:hypothetical protein
MVLLQVALEGEDECRGRFHPYGACALRCSRNGVRGFPPWPALLLKGRQNITRSVMTTSRSAWRSLSLLNRSAADADSVITQFAPANVEVICSEAVPQPYPGDWATSAVAGGCDGASSSRPEAK